MRTNKYICTVFTDSHIAGALVLWESVRQYGPAWKFLAFRIGEGNLPSGVPDDFARCCVDLFQYDFCHPGMRFWYDPFELCCGIRGAMHYYMYHCTDAEEWWAIDSDCCFFSSLDELSSMFVSGCIALTPHRRTCNVALRCAELSIMSAGIYNGGCLGVRRNQETKLFVEWFNERLTWLAFSECGLDLYVDQKWLDWVPVHFSTTIIKHLGVNIGFWNVDEAALARYGSKMECKNAAEPILVHFSQVDFHGSIPISYQKTVDGVPMPAFYMEWARKFSEQHRIWKDRLYNINAYPYSQFDDGRIIAKPMRRAYYCDVLSGFAGDNPFGDSCKYISLNDRNTNARFANISSACAAQYARSVYVNMFQHSDIRSVFGSYMNVFGFMVCEMLDVLKRCNRKLIRTLWY